MIDSRGGLWLRESAFAKCFAISARLSISIHAKPRCKWSKHLALAGMDGWVTGVAKWRARGSPPAGRTADSQEEGREEDGQQDRLGYSPNSSVYIRHTVLLLHATTISW
jgi:hypothetical protein